jgi:hypothetical protein
MEVLELAREGQIRPHVAEFPLEHVEDAYAQLRQGRLDGRAMIVPPGERGATGCLRGRSTCAAARHRRPADAVLPRNFTATGRNRRQRNAPSLLSALTTTRRLDRAQTRVGIPTPPLRVRQGRVLRAGLLSVPEVGHALGVATSGLAAADADEIQAVRARRERADDGGRDAQHVPCL